MVRKLLATAALLTAGCDSSAVLANIDTYTCAYLPTVVDCTTQEVHDKAVSILTDGLIAGEVKCSGQWFVGTTDGAGVSPPAPDSGLPVYYDFTYRAQKFQDGTCFMVWSDYSPTLTTEFIARHSSKHVNCEVGISGSFVAANELLTITSHQHSWRYVGGPRNDHSSWEAYLPSPAPTTVFDMATQCTGFNFDAFDAL